jgi:PAS domain S-box-containing protein
MNNIAIPDRLLLSGFLAATPDHVYFKDLSSRFLWCSASLARSLGCTVDEVIGRTDADFFDAEKAAIYRKAEQEILTTGKSVIDQIVEHTWPDGEKTWSLNVAMPLHAESGEIIGIWGTNKDITEQVLMERALKAAEERAILESQAKSQFLAVVSHEIRNPLNAVIGFADLLLDSPLDRMQRDYAATVRESGRSMLMLIQDLLDFSKIEAGALELEQLHVNVFDTLEQVARLVSLQAHAKGVEVSLDINPSVPEIIQGDPTRLSQVLLNLGSNAAKFCERGEITFSVTAVEKSSSSVILRFDVQDTGIGIPADRIDAVFQLYSQADRSTARRFGGTGLGLPIVKRIVELMGGETYVCSQVGRGSTFSFTVPFTLVPSDLTVQQKSLSILKGNVLVVDDHATQRRVLARQLRQCGLEVTCASSADEAMENLVRAAQNKRSFDAVLLDHHMPVCDGLELAQRIRSDSRINSARLVLLTSTGHRSEGFEGMGLSAVLTKPVVGRDLIDALLLVLAGQADWQSQSNSIITRQLLSTHRGREKRHILVAEDRPEGRKVACHTLRRLGYKATGVANGREAVETWKTGEFHLILMDCEMPEMDGFEATRQIRRLERAGEHIPIIALTGRVMAGAEQECRSAGMDSYFEKPFDRDRLEACLDRILGCESIDTTGQYSISTTAKNSAPETAEDFAALRVLAEGDRAFMCELIQDFLEQSDKTLEELDSAVAEHDAARLARVAHALKTACGALGARKLHASVKLLESSARAGTVDRSRVEQVRDDLDVAVKYVRTLAP